MEVELVIRGGTIVDGTGGDPFKADIAIHAGKIVAVAGDLGNLPSNVEVIDAKGCIVTPGFVDIHTHYDGQAVWSDRLAPSSLHGVTTVVGGNCGVGFAPCRADDHDALIELMEGVEDIPGAVLAEGLDWSWESFGGYLNTLEARPRDIDFAAYIPHSPLRVYVMGERGIKREPATAEDLAQMRSLVADGIRAGALGCATSRLFYHRTAKGELIPTHAAVDAELDVLAQGMADGGGGILQAVPDVQNVELEDEIAVLAGVARRNNQRVTFTGMMRGEVSTLTDPLDACIAEGLDLTAQIFPRPIGMVMGLGLTWNPFSFCASFRPLAELTVAERAEKMRDPELRAALLGETPNYELFPLARQTRNYAQMFVLRDPPDYEPPLDQSIAAIAERVGKSPEEVAYDALLDDDGEAMLLVAMGNYASGSLDHLVTLMHHPATVLGLGDGGAHYGLICDASYPTTVLTHWVRDRRGERMELPFAIRELTRRPAEVVGLMDRGMVSKGYKADLNVIDLEALRLFKPEVVHDLPAGGRRLMQRASGYRATIVSGEVVYRDGESSGALPGKLVRGRQAQPVIEEMAI